MNFVSLSVDEGVENVAKSKLAGRMVVEVKVVRVLKISVSTPGCHMLYNDDSSLIHCQPGDYRIPPSLHHIT